MYDNSAARILITFDRDTDKTISLFNPKEVQLRGRDSCAKILKEGPALLANVTTAKWLGADSVCYFVNPSVLAAQCGPGASVLPWDTLEIVPDRIRSCATSFESTSGDCTLTVPLCLCCSLSVVLLLLCYCAHTALAMPCCSHCASVHSPSQRALISLSGYSHCTSVHSPSRGDRHSADQTSTGAASAHCGPHRSLQTGCM